MILLAIELTGLSSNLRGIRCYMIHLAFSLFKFDLFLLGLLLIVILDSLVKRELLSL